MYVEIGERIRKARKAKRLTQETLARETGISASFLGHIERGTRVLSVETLVKLCQTLHVTPNELLGMEYPPEQSFRPESLNAFGREATQCMIDLMRKHGFAE